MKLLISMTIGQFQTQECELASNLQIRRHPTRTWLVLQEALERAAAAAIGRW